MNPNEQITLVLPRQYVNLILDALADRPIRQAIDAFSMVQQQLNKAEEPPKEA